MPAGTLWQQSIREPETCRRGQRPDFLLTTGLQCGSEHKREVHLIIFGQLGVWQLSELSAEQGI
jgi:hypothetical protein